MEEPRDRIIKRVRRHVTSQDHVFLAVAQPALRSVLRNELETLGFDAGADTDGGVEFGGRLREGWRANLLLRTASRVYCRILDFRAGASEELFRKTSAFPWELWLPASAALGISSRVRNSRIRHEGEAAATLYEGISRRFEERGASQPVLREKKAGGAEFQRILLRIIENRCLLSLDMSGSALYNRGYRLENSGAPIREDLAASLLRGLGRPEGGILLDGMTGSGTFAVEAASAAAGFVPGGDRPYRFQSWPSFGEAAWRHLRKETAAKDPGVLIYASDIDGSAVETARRNAERAGVRDFALWRTRDFFDLTEAEVRREIGAAAGAEGFLVLNPPYGKRIAGGEADFFRLLGVHIRKNFPGWKSLMLFPDEASLRAFGGKPARRILFRHGGLLIIAGYFDG